MPINFSSTISKILNSKTPTVGVCVFISIGFGCLQATRAKRSDKSTLFFKHLALAFTCLAFSEN